MVALVQISYYFQNWSPDKNPEHDSVYSYRYKANTVQVEICIQYIYL